jgi:hypothetical protein
VQQSECNTTFCPPSEIQVISHIKRIPLLKLPSFLHQKYIVESLTINQIATLTLSSRSTVIKYLNAAEIPIREEEHRRGGSAFGERKFNGRYIPNKTELDLIEKMMTLRKQGLTFHKIAEILQGLSLPTKRNGKWTGRSIQRIFLKMQIEKHCNGKLINLPT